MKIESTKVGNILAAVFAVPILICLVVNLAVSGSLTWFYIVLAAMLIPASLIVVPVMAQKDRMILTMGALVVSVLVLLAVCSRRLGGDWFYVAASAVVFGAAVCFGPFIACRRPVSEYLGDQKGIAVMKVCTAAFFVMMVCIGFYVKTPGYFPKAFTISVPLVLLAWILFWIIRYLPANAVFKAGACLAMLSLAAVIAIKAVGLYAIINNEVISCSRLSNVSILTGFVISVILMGIGSGSVRHE